MELKNKIVVITGGTKGLGKALALSFAQKGAQVISTTHSETSREDFPESVIFIKTDVRSEKEVSDLAKNVIEKFGRIDIWINNAGMLYSFNKEDEYIDMDKAHEIMDVNFFGTVFGCRTALKYMKEQGGSIVTILSTAALDATKSKGLKIYAASKWAVNGYLQGFKAENEDSNVSVISVYPGGMQTELWREYKPEKLPEYMSPEFVAEKIIQNLELEQPEGDLVIKRPGK